ncbi:MAG: hypothetical protein MJZ61_00135 [Bacteroidales bacterium]|nr:hypothetical protein [Bacteroidales bacterium]
MTFDDEDIFDKEDNTASYRENESEEVLNADYDRVSLSGEMPNIDEFLGTDYHDPMSEFGYNEGIGEAIDDPRISDEIIPDDEFAEDSDEAEQAETPGEPVKLTFKSLMDGNYIKSEAFTSMFPFMVFVLSLFVLYIANRNMAESFIKRELELRREVRELRAESITLAAELMSISKETEVAKRVEEKQLGIHLIKEPPMYFVIDKYEQPDSLKKDDYESQSRAYYNDFNDFEDEYKKIY